MLDGHGDGGGIVSHCGDRQLGGHLDRAQRVVAHHLVRGVNACEEGAAGVPDGSRAAVDRFWGESHRAAQPRDHRLHAQAHTQDGATKRIQDGGAEPNVIRVVRGARPG